MRSKEEISSITNSSSPFYVIGGTLDRNAGCYVVRQADRELLANIRAGKFCYVLTPRQMGKSSLMVRAAVKLRAEGFNVAALDLTAIGQNLTPEQWYDGLLMNIGQQLHLEDELEDFWLEHKNIGPLQRWMMAIREVILPHCPGVLVIFIDEIDAVRNLPFSTDEFFAAIREFHNRRTQDEELHRLTFCLLGVATPSDLIRDTRTTPFNIGYRVELQDFTADEAAPLAQGLRSDPALSLALLERILYWTGGHPYLTQRLCKAVCEDANALTSADVDRICQGLFFSSRAKERDNNLLFVRERLLRSEVDLASLLELYQRVLKGKRVLDDETDPLVSVIRLSGITRVRNGRLEIRNQIYSQVFDERWILANMPQAELRRQRAAFYRGVLRATAIAAFVLIGFAYLAYYARQQQQTAEEQRANYRRLLYAAQMNLAYQAWDKANLRRTLELLEAQIPKQGQEDLRNFEWYCLWRLTHSEAFTMPGKGAPIFSPDNKTMLIIKGEIVESFDIASGQKLGTLSGHTTGISRAVFSADGKRLATGDANGTVIIWDLAERRPLQTIAGHAGIIISLAFSPDGKRLAVGSGSREWGGKAEPGQIKLWDLTESREIGRFKGHTDGVSGLHFTPDGKILASGSYDESLRFWDTATLRELAVFNPHANWVQMTAITPDGKILAAAHSGRVVTLWDIAARKQLGVLQGHTSIVFNIAISPDGQMLASGSSDGTIRLWDIATQKELKTIRASTEAAIGLGFSPDGKYLISRGKSSKDDMVIFWDVAQELNDNTFRSSTPGRHFNRVSRDGKRLYMINAEGIIEIWDIATRARTTITKPQAEITMVELSPDEKILACGHVDGSVELFDTSSWQQLARLDLWSSQAEKERTFEYARTVRYLFFTADSKTLMARCYDGTLKIWDRQANGEFTLRNLPVESLNKSTALTSPDGNYTIIANDSASVWDASLTRQIVNLGKDCHHALKFSPRSDLLVGVGPEDKVVIFETKTWRRLASFNGNGMGNFAISHDGQRLVTASGDGIARLWDIASGQELAMLTGHGGTIEYVAFLDDSKTIVVGSRTGLVKFWHSAGGAEMTNRRINHGDTEITEVK